MCGSGASGRWCQVCPIANSRHRSAALGLRLAALDPGRTLAIAQADQTAPAVLVAPRRAAAVNQPAGAVLPASWQGLAYGLVGCHAAGAAQAAAAGLATLGRAGAVIACCGHAGLTVKGAAAVLQAGQRRLAVGIALDRAAWALVGRPVADLAAAKVVTFPGRGAIGWWCGQAGFPVTLDLGPVLAGAALTLVRAAAVPVADVAQAEFAAVRSSRAVGVSEGTARSVHRMASPGLPAASCGGTVAVAHCHTGARRHMAQALGRAVLAVLALGLAGRLTGAAAGEAAPPAPTVEATVAAQQAVAVRGAHTLAIPGRAAAVFAAIGVPKVSRIRLVRLGIAALGGHAVLVTGGDASAVSQ